MNQPKRVSIARATTCHWLEFFGNGSDASSMNLLDTKHHKKPSTMRSSSKIARGVLILFFLTPLLINTKADKSSTTMWRTNIVTHAPTTSPTTSTKNRKQEQQECSSGMNGDQGNQLAFLSDLRTKYADQPTFLQAVEEMALNLLPLFEDADNGDFYKRAFLALALPERIISFRVPWEDDNGNIQYNRGWRVEFSRYATFDLLTLICPLYYHSIILLTETDHHDSQYFKIIAS
jgi:hypothetical protein